MDASPTAYLNYYLFDGDRNQYDMGFVQVSETAAITSSGNLSGGHEKLRIEVPVTQAGYVHVEFSHDAPDGVTQDVDIYFDDFRVEHKHGAIVQADDYYPFGLTFNSYVSGEKNRYLFQGQEHQEETGWDSFKWRNHQPDIGRFFNIDPLAHDYVYNSPYAFSENDVIRAIELEGLEKVILFGGADLKGDGSVGTAKDIAQQIVKGSGDKLRNNSVVLFNSNLYEANRSLNGCLR